MARLYSGGKIIFSKNGAEKTRQMQKKKKKKKKEIEETLPVSENNYLSEDHSQLTEKHVHIPHTS